MFKKNIKFGEFKIKYFLYMFEKMLVVNSFGLLRILKYILNKILLMSYNLLVDHNVILL